MKIPAMDILKTDVNLTILGGKVVFSGPEFSPAP